MIIEYKQGGYVPEIGSKWKHFRTGTIYKVLDLVIHTETNELLVVYTDGVHKWARPLREEHNKDTMQSCWNDKIDGILRFELIKEENEQRN